MSKAPIFIIGTERSGTNLLRLILNTHPAIAIPHPPHIVRLFTPLMPLYGNLADDRNFRRLVNDVCRLVELHTYPWGIVPDREKAFNNALSRELICIYFTIYDQYLEHVGKERWCCKSTFMIDHVADILRFYPDARFIFMVRDGRDVAVSAKLSIFNHYHIYYSAKRWQREQRTGIEWLASLPAEQIFLLKYEELLKAPQAVVKLLCTFLDLPYDDNMLEYHRMSEAKRSGSLSISWENTAKPLLQDNNGRFRKSLTNHEILLFEAIAGEEMRTLGYQTDNPAEHLLQIRNEMLKEKLLYRLTEYGMKVKTEFMHLLRDTNSLPRIKKNMYISYLKHIRKMTSH